MNLIYSSKNVIIRYSINELKRYIWFYLEIFVIRMSRTIIDTIDQSCQVTVSGSRKYSYALSTSFMIILHVLLEIFGNLISTIITSNYHYYIGKILNNFENIYRNYNTFNNYIFKYSIKVLFFKYIYCKDHKNI